MSRTIFITGGARSGKSVLAETLAEALGGPLCYLATGIAADGEMAERIAAHRARRGDAWATREEPYLLPDAVREADGEYRAILVDCITLWISNLLLRHENSQAVLDEVGRLLDTLRECSTPVILVSNEVGMGIVPENALARAFRDLAGKTNQMIAAAADEVYVIFSGIPLRLK